MDLFSLFLFRQADASILATFRIFFGATLFWETCRYFYYNRIEDYFIFPMSFFTYPFFEFVTPLPGNWMYLPFVLMGLTSALIAVGFFYSAATIAFFLPIPTFF